MIKMKGAMRPERDSMGTIEVPEECLWGAQTARSLRYFAIGEEKMPRALLHALALVKKAAAYANAELGLLPHDKYMLIAASVDDILNGAYETTYKAQFPLSIWQTGSGTQTNMNMNEVIANCAIQRAGGVLGSKDPIHPNDHVNMSQSSNDVFPTAMHIATAKALVEHVLPELRALRDALQAKVEQWGTLVKIGRTHLMDAVPLTLGQEFSGYVQQLDEDIERIASTLPRLYELALGGTAVGTGLNAPKGFAELAVGYIARTTNLPFKVGPNFFSLLAAHDALVFVSGTLKVTAISLYKIANDIRLMGSGPSCGLAELILPANEPGSSIMPGKVNPTQCEALAMIAAQVMGNDVAISFAGSQGHFELNVYKPLIIYNILQSTRLLADGCRAFRHFLVEGLKPNYARLEQNVAHCLMLVTALSPLIGYDKAAQVASKALKEGISLRQAAADLGVMSPEEFDHHIDPLKMTQGGSG